MPALPPSVWRDLPDPEDELEQAAAAYYGCDPAAIVAVPGSQAALQAVPALLDRGPVAVPLRGYGDS